MNYICKQVNIGKLCMSWMAISIWFHLNCCYIRMFSVTETAFLSSKNPMEWHTPSKNQSSVSHMAQTSQQNIANDEATILVFCRKNPCATGVLAYSGAPQGVRGLGEWIFPRPFLTNFFLTSPLVQ